MIEREFEKVHALAMEVHSLKECERVILYGELFGGIYPGAEKQDKKPPQFTIYYSPLKLFSLFDIACEGCAYLAYE